MCYDVFQGVKSDNWSHLRARGGDSGGVREIGFAIDRRPRRYELDDVFAKLMEHYSRAQLRLCNKGLHSF